MNCKKTRSVMWGRKFLTVFVLILSSSLAFAGHRKMSREFDGKKGSDMVNVIVQFNQAPGARDHQKITKRGGKMNRQLGRFRGGAYRISRAKLAELAADPDVMYISPDRPIKGAGARSSGFSLDYHNEAINTFAASAQGLDGTGVGVAVIDSGIANVNDLTASNIVFSQDFTGDSAHGAADQYGHGTHIAGIIAGNGNSSTGATSLYRLKGIASNVNLVNLRVLDENGVGTESEAIAAIQAAIQLKDTYNIRVINLSLGAPVLESYTLDPLCQAVEQAWQAGITVVAAAGNYGRNNNAGTHGYGTITSPGNDPYVITVGAMNTEGTPDRTDDVPASYSSKGPTLYDDVVKPDLVAPGNLIVSLYTPGDTLNQENPGNVIPTSLYLTDGSAAPSNSYFILSGTSMAAPMVSGAAALMLQQNAALTPDQVKARLMETSFKNLQQFSTVTDQQSGQIYNEQADVFTVGAGYLDIQAALANTDLAPAAVGSALSPFAGIDTNGEVVLVVNGPSVLGASGTAYDSAILWGTGIVPGSGSTGGGDAAILWGTSALWSNGTSGGGDAAILWGTGVLWGSSSLPDAAILWGTTAKGGGDAAILWGTSAAAGGDAAILWGTSMSLDDQIAILWGTSVAGGGDAAILWGTSTVQANSVLWGSKSNDPDSPSDSPKK